MKASRAVFSEVSKRFSTMPFALRALATEGIQRGHMSLHARSVALAVGAVEAEVDEIAAELVRRGEVKSQVALELLLARRGQKTA